VSIPHSKQLQLTVCYDSNMSKVFALIVVVILVLVGLYFYDKRNDRRDCEDRAVAAAVDTYPPSQYPDTTQREGLQTTYKNRYLETCN